MITPGAADARSYTAGPGGKERHARQRDRQATGSGTPDEDLQSSGQGGRHDVAAVGRAGVEPFADRGGDLLWRARERPVPAPAAEPADQLPDGEILPLCEIGNQLAAALRPPPPRPHEYFHGQPP